MAPTVHMPFLILPVSALVATLFQSALVGSPHHAKAPACDWETMSHVLFGNKTAVCEYTGDVAVRLTEDGNLFVGFRDPSDDRSNGFMLIQVVTSKGTVPGRWNWSTRSGFVRIQPGGLYVNGGQSDTPPLAFGHSVDDLAVKYPDAYRVGIIGLVAIDHLGFDFADFVGAKPSNRCAHDRGRYNCYEANGKAFQIR